MTEANIMRQVQIDISAAGSRMFRNNVGVAWIGQTTGPERAVRTVTVHPGDVVVRAARRFNAGLCEGSGDLIGWTPIVIRPHHIGYTIGAFTSLEVKTDKGRATPKQANFSDQVNKAGGLAGVVRNSAQALAVIRRFELGDCPDGRVNG